LVLLWKSFHNAITDKHVCRAKHSTMNDPISGSGTMYEAVESILLFEEEIANLQILPAIVSARSYSSANGSGLRFEPSQSIRDNTRSVSVTDLVWNRKINPGMVFVLTLPLDQVAEGDRAMDERRAIKTLLRRLRCSRKSSQRHTYGDRRHEILRTWTAHCLVTGKMSEKCVLK
jgi:hypothetical protein